MARSRPPSRPTSRDGPLKSVLKHQAERSPCSSPPLFTADSSAKITFASTTSGDPLPADVSNLSLDDSLSASVSGSSAAPPSASTLSSPRGSRPTLNPSKPSRTVISRSSSDVPEGYARRVAFSTLDAEEGTGGGGIGAEFSFTLGAKSKDYVSTRESRSFLVASDGASYSLSAIDWLMETLVEDGDEVVVLRVIEPGSAAHKEFALDHVEGTKAEAEDVLQYVLNRNDRQITVSVELVIGSVVKTIQRMLEVYRPDSLVVGTRGRTDSAWKKAFLGSTSQYLVARSPVPVIVVRPENKVRKSVEARKNDPKRQSYKALLGHNRNRSNDNLASTSGRMSMDQSQLSSKELRREKTSPC